MKDDLVATVRIFWYGAVLLALVVTGTVVGWFMWPTHMAVERDVMQQSHQYTDAKRSMLLKMVEDYEACETDVAKYRASDSAKFKDVIKGLENQQDSLLNRIRNESRMLPSDQVPESVRRLSR